MDWVAVVQQLDRDLLAIEITKSGLSLQEDRIRSISYFEKESGAPIPKQDLKEIGAARFTLEQVGVEALIGLTANAIETFSIRLKRHLHTEWEPFKTPLNHIRFAERPRQLRAINNVYKHQEGYIESASSRSAKYLVDSGYFKDETYLKWYSSKDILGDVELALYETFAHLYGVAAAIAGFPNISPKGSGAELIKGLKDRVVYSAIQGSLGGDAS
jgi:hypothetical protein